jgi:hypothetical protein
MAGMRRVLGFPFALVGLVSVFADGAGCSSSTDACSGASAKLIQASDYDQSCKVDTDCQPIAVGNVCEDSPRSCPSIDAINVSALARYNSDVANTPAASLDFSECAASAVFACCGRDGFCHMNGADECFMLMPLPPTCALGATCSPTDQCPGGIAGCTSNCQCLNGTWQAPCPKDLPQTGSVCAPFAAEESLGAECGYSTSTNACGAENCSCEAGTWRCGPSCATGPENDSGALCAAAGGQCVFGGCSNPGPQACGSAGMFCCLNGVPDGDASADADACAPSGCTGSCLSGRHNVSTMVDGCLVWECCVPDDAGADASGPLDAGGE